MRCTSWLLPALATLVVVPLALPGTALADELTMAPAPTASEQHPARGMSMDNVEAKFGTPVKRAPAVGEPPITRWEYPGFVVFFEHNRVLHSVITS